MAGSSYDGDIVAWASEQARLLRAGLFSQLDIEHVIEEIEDVGKSEKRELASRLAVLLAHLLKWQYQPERQGNSWRRTIKEQRNVTALLIKKTPSLRAEPRDPRLVVWRLVGCRDQGVGRDWAVRFPRTLSMGDRRPSPSGMAA